MLASLPQRVESALRNSPVVSPVLDGWSKLALPNCWLVAGSVFQTYWNSAFDYEPEHGIDDIDLVYFDAKDLSEEAEDQHSKRIGNQFKHLGIKFDVKNEARVHLWYEDHFGYAIEPYDSVESAMKTFPTTAGAIGVRSNNGKLEAFAPFGFSDLTDLVIRPNKRQISAAIYANKVARWKTYWPDIEYRKWGA